MSEFNGKKFYGFSLHNDPTLSTNTRNFEFKYTRPEQLERAIQKVHQSDHDRHRKLGQQHKNSKPKAKLPVVPEVMSPYQSRDIDVETHISRNDMSKIRTLSENEVNHLIGWARNSSELDESFFRRRPVAAAPRYHVTVDASCGTDSGAGEGITILHKDSTDSFDYGEIGAVETSVNVNYHATRKNTASVNTASVNTASVNTATTTTMGCMHVALREMPNSMFKLPDLPEEDELSSRGSTIYASVHDLLYCEQQPKWVEIQEVPPKEDMIVTEIVKASEPKPPMPNMSDFRLERPSVTNPLLMADFRQECSMLRNASFRNDHGHEGPALLDPMVMGACGQEGLLMRSTPFSADLERELSILQERSLMPRRSGFGSERSMMRDSGLMADCMPDVAKPPMFIDFGQEPSILRDSAFCTEMRRESPLRETRPEQERSNMEDASALSSGFGLETELTRHQPAGDDFDRESLLMRDTPLQGDFGQEHPMMPGPPATSSMPNMLTMGPEGGIQNTYYAEDSDLEYEMMGRATYTKYCGPRPKLDELPNMSNESGGVPEFIEIEPQIPCMDLSFLKNASPIRYSDQIDEKDEIQSLDMVTANSRHVSPIPVKAPSKTKPKDSDKDSKKKRPKKTVEKVTSSSPRAKQSKTCATPRSPASPRSPGTYRKCMSSPRQSPKLNSQRSRNSSIHTDLRSVKNVVLTKSIEDLKIEKLAIFTKMRSTQERIIEMLDKLRIALLEIYVPDNSYEKNKRQKNAFEFTVRFSRNFLYPLKGMIDDLRLLTSDQLNSAASNDASQRVLAIFSLISQSLQTYQKQLRYFLLDQVPQKLSTLMEMSLNAVNICLDKQVFDRHDTIIECLQDRCSKFIGFLEDMHEDRFLAARENYRKSGYDKSQAASNYNLKMFMNDLNMYEPKLVPKNAQIGRRHSRRSLVKSSNHKKSKNASRPHTPRASDMVLSRHGGDAIETHIECSGMLLRSSDLMEQSDKIDAGPKISQADITTTNDCFEGIATDASNLNKALIEALQTVTKEQVRQVLEPIMQSLGTALDKKNASKSIEEMLSAFNINLAMLSEGDNRKQPDAQVNQPACKVSGAKVETTFADALPNDKVLQQNVTNALKAANHTEFVMRRPQPTGDSARCGRAAVDCHVGDGDANNSGRTNSVDNDDNGHEPYSGYGGLVSSSHQSAYARKFNMGDEASERALSMGRSEDGESEDGNFNNFNVILALKPADDGKPNGEKNAPELCRQQPLQKQLQKQPQKQQPKQRKSNQQQQQQQLVPLLPLTQHKRPRQHQQQQQLQQQHPLVPPQQPAGKHQRKSLQQHAPPLSKPPPYRPKQKLYDDKRYGTPRAPVQAFNLYSKPTPMVEAPPTHRGSRKTGGFDKFSSTCLDSHRNGVSKSKMFKKRRNPLLPPPPAPTATPSTSARERKRRALLQKQSKSGQHHLRHNAVTAVEGDFGGDDTAGESDAAPATNEGSAGNYIVVSSHMSKIASQLKCELSDVFIPCTQSPFDMQPDLVRTSPNPVEHSERLTATQSRCVAEVITKCLLSLHLDAEAAKSAMLKVSNSQIDNSSTAPNNPDLCCEAAWRKSQNLLHHQLLLEHQMQEKREQRMVLQAQLKQKMDEEQRRQQEICTRVSEAQLDTCVEPGKELQPEQDPVKQPDQSEQPDQPEQFDQTEQPDQLELLEQFSNEDLNQNQNRSDERKTQKKRAQPAQEKPKAKQSKRQVLGELNPTSSEKENTNPTNGNGNNCQNAGSTNCANGNDSNAENSLDGKVDLRLGDLLRERDDFLQQCNKNRFYSNPNYNQPWRVFSRLSTKLSNEIIGMIEEDFTVGVSKFVQDFLETETQI